MKIFVRTDYKIYELECVNFAIDSASNLYVYGAAKKTLALFAAGEWANAIEFAPTVEEAPKAKKLKLNKKEFLKD